MDGGCSQAHFDGTQMVRRLTRMERGLFAGSLDGMLYVRKLTNWNRDCSQAHKNGTRICSQAHKLERR